MSIRKAEQAIVNGIYAGVAWLVLDFGLLLQQHGAQIFTVLTSTMAMVAGSVIVIACIVGLLYKSRTAASVLFVFFLVPLVLRSAQGVVPSPMMIIFSLILLYFFMAAVLGTFKYHQLIESGQQDEKSD
jgi:hypothetical protein